MPGKSKYPQGYMQRLVRTGHPDSPDECWLWPGCVDARGYGLVRWEGRRWFAHRASYVVHVGPIQDGLVLDHTCGIRACFNPRHLEPVTQLKNCQNRHMLDRRNRTGYRGVYLDKRTGKYMAQVQYLGKSMHIGSYANAEGAGRAAEAKRRELGFRDTTR